MVLSSCKSDDSETYRFQKLDSSETGIHFENRIQADDTYNVQADIFIYNGAGVAIGDINNDGYPDIYLSGNKVSGRLYLNKGDYQFEDITESAGIETVKWVTGASMVDINDDGFLDIYLSVSGPEWTTSEDRENLLFLNNGDNTFTEAAAKYNINDSGFTTHALFLDYNGSGYLDLFLLSNSPGEFGRGESGFMGFGARGANPDGFDKLYRNNGDGTFTDVSEEAGILKRLGYGLGVVATDLNGNGWPDIYVSNDITPNDVLYINNGDGTFTDRASDFLRHTSFAGMGIDIADFTNNGWPDIMQTDMKPRELSSRKRVSGSNTIHGLQDMRLRGYFPHYNLNALQYHQGVTENGDIIFSQISRMAGVSDTDWSWTALFGDYDNDGWKDLLITNGYPKAVNDFDYQSDMFEARRLPNSEMVKERELEILDQLHGYEVTNHIFHNNRDLTFTEKTQEWGLNEPGFSYGAAHADLNNTGRLDLVINNINSPASIYKSVIPKESVSNNFLQIKLNGKSPNRRGIGSKLYLTAGNERQYLYHSPYRGYMSTMDDRAHFGIGQSTEIDSLEIVWPDGSKQVLYDIQPNQIITLDQNESNFQSNSNSNDSPDESKYFQELYPLSVLEFNHTENFYSSDYSIQPLLPYEISKQGPVIAVADVDGDGLDDLYIGGERNIAGKLFLQQTDGQFTEISVPDFETDHHLEDWGAVFFDANGNGLPDLYVASGSYQAIPDSDMLQDRLYINMGDGVFQKDPDALPQIKTPTSAIAVGDINGDGEFDLFVGGRISPGKYPLPVRSYILQNDMGSFKDVTEEFAPELVVPKGMITDATWMDFNNNGYQDLITVGEWMSIEFYVNNGIKLTNTTANMNLPPTLGMWFSMTTGDFNGDGFNDIAVGNLGLNHSYQTDQENPFEIYADDFSENGTIDIILTKEINQKDYPIHGYALLGRELIPIATGYNSFDSFSDVSINEIFGLSRVEESTHYKADTFSSVWLENKGDGTFTFRELPNEAQISSIQAIISMNLTNNGCEDLIIAGNILHTEANTAPLDAGSGLLLKCDKSGNFTPVPILESGFYTPGDVRNLSIVKGRQKLLIAGNNSDRLQIFRLSN
tara:strand:- start:22601 stop:25903 length:3303 start_codon:yes stop_codon:yes gene_type:complete